MKLDEIKGPNGTVPGQVTVHPMGGGGALARTDSQGSQAAEISLQKYKCNNDNNHEPLPRSVILIVNSTFCGLVLLRKSAEMNFLLYSLGGFVYANPRGHLEEASSLSHSVYREILVYEFCFCFHIPWSIWGNICRAISLSL